MRSIKGKLKTVDRWHILLMLEMRVFPLLVLPYIIHVENVRQCSFLRTKFFQSTLKSGKVNRLARHAVFDKLHLKEVFVLCVIIGTRKIFCLSSNGAAVCVCPHLHVLELHSRKLLTEAGRARTAWEYPIGRIRRFNRMTISSPAVAAVRDT